MEGIEKQEGRDSKGYKSLAAVVAYYGEAGVDNGVVVTVGTISNQRGAEAQAVSRTRITVDVERVTGNSENIKLLNTSDVHGRVGLAYGAAVMAHEGSHALDRPPFATRETLSASEIAAYTTDSYVFRGHGINGPTWNRYWTPADQRRAIENNAAASVNLVWR
jgi:hypothetical protein